MITGREGLIALLACAVLSCAQGESEVGQSPGPGPDGGGDVSLADVDGDGFTRSDDCNDHNASINPSVPERCDDIDQDCDGKVDEGVGSPEVYYADSDGDGFGDPEVSVMACQPPPNHVANGEDCYDDNVDVHPGQTEFFTVERGDGSFDYDCSEEIDSSIPDGNCAFSQATGDCNFIPGWDGAPPACGTSGDAVNGCLTLCIGVCICEASTSSELNQCR